MVSSFGLEWFILSWWEGFLWDLESAKFIEGLFFYYFLIISLCSVTVIWLWATQPIQSPKLVEGDVMLAITWIMCTLWLRTHSTWYEENERKSAGSTWIKVVCRPNFFFIILKLRTILSKLSYVVILLLIICVLDISRFQFHLSHSSACDVPCLLGRDGTDDVQKVTWQIYWVWCACQGWSGVKAFLVIVIGPSGVIFRE